MLHLMLSSILTIAIIQHIWYWLIIATCTKIEQISLLLCSPYIPRMGTIKPRTSPAGSAKIKNTGVQNIMLQRYSFKD